MADNRIGLLGVAAWLLGVIFVACGIGGIFNLPEDQVKPEVHVAYVAQTLNPSCTIEYPRGFAYPRTTTGTVKLGKKQFTVTVSKEPPTCTGGELQSTWRICTPRLSV